MADSPTGDQGIVYEEFKEQLTRSDKGWYETGLPWKGNHPPLPNNKEGSLQRLTSLIRKLETTQSIKDYDAVIQEQLAEGIVERAPSIVEGREFYIPHKAVVRETTETTKLRVVYNAFAQAWDGAPSLNECLNTGPPLQISCGACWFKDISTQLPSPETSRKASYTCESNPKIAMLSDSTG